MNLVLVESPAKAKTIERILGKDYKVVATLGHLIDLPKSKLGVDLTTFEPEYVPIKGKGKLLRFIKQQVKGASLVLLAQDPDREGEAIAWQVLKLTGLPEDSYKRIVFHEITKEAIKKAVEQGRRIDLNLVEAQQARRVLDRLVGYPLSELLWHKIRYGLSAGRVQSAALRLIVERQEEIDAFEPEVFLTVVAKTSLGDFLLSSPKDFKPLRFAEDKRQSLLEKIEHLRTLKIVRLERSEAVVNPPPPLITSSLQQEANRRFGFSAKTTMRLAQELYQGLDIPGIGRRSLITYMRTDSVRLSNYAISQSRKFIEHLFGREFLNPTVRRYKTRSKNAQEAHEAIRPVHFELSPDVLKDKLSKPHWLIYNLVWERTIATQMKPALYDVYTIHANPEILDGVWILKRRFLKEPGFLILAGKTKEDEGAFKDLLEGAVVTVNEVAVVEKQTSPPLPYTDASLVKTLEKLGIGRPSTFATIIDTLLKRGYVQREGRFLIPTDNGKVVAGFLKKHFPEIVDYEFTANMEDSLDKIARGELSKEGFLKNFYPTFIEKIEKKEKEVDKSDVVVLEKTDVKCPKCGADMVLKLGKFGKFYSCSRYPECDGMLSYIDENKYEIPPEAKKGEWVLKVGKYGRFWAHKDYPKIKQTAPLLLKEKCPKCGSPLVERRGKNGRVFIGCSNYPKCKFIKR